MRIGIRTTEGISLITLSAGQTWIFMKHPTTAPCERSLQMGSELRVTDFCWFAVFALR